MELNTLKEPLSINNNALETPVKTSKKKLGAQFQSTFKKNSLVSKSGINFKSFDHYVFESFAQSLYPKNNKEDLDLVFIKPEDIEQDILDEKQQYEDYELPSKNICTRFFGPINPGSMRASIFALMACSLGAGSLALPKALFVHCGLITGIFLLIFIAWVVLYCLKLLIKTSMRTNITNYSELVKHCFSERIAKLTDLIFVVYCFGTILGYQIIITQFSLTTLKKFGMDPSLVDNKWTQVIQAVGLAIIDTPIALQKSFYSLRHVSLLGVLSLIYAALMVICECPSYVAAFWDSDKISYFVWDWNLFTGFSTAVFSYTCTTVVLPIKKELINPAEYRIAKIFNRSVFMELVIYMSIALSGYLSLLSETPDIILDRPTLPGSKDIAVTIARIAIVINLAISIPININPGRTHFFILINKEEGSKFLHCLVTFGFLYLSMLISIVFPDILSAFSFLGGACSVIIGITFPILMWIQVNGKEKWSAENVVLGISCVVLTATGLIAGTLSFLQALKIIKI